MNSKAIGITLGLLGAGLAGLYFYLNRKSANTNSIPDLSTKIPSTANGTTIVNAPASTPSKNTIQYQTTGFVVGNPVYAMRYTNTYKTPVFSTVNLYKGFAQTAQIGAYAGKQDSDFSKVIIEGNPYFVKTADIYQ